MQLHSNVVASLLKLFDFFREFYVCALDLNFFHGKSRNDLWGLFRGQFFGIGCREPLSTVCCAVLDYKFIKQILSWHQHLLFVNQTSVDHRERVQNCTLREEDVQVSRTEIKSSASIPDYDEVMHYLDDAMTRIFD